jgi:enamine deaminase RidA (YjgF/YER057c/UK114 family)
MTREYLDGTRQSNRSYSPAVVTRGGRTVWLAGHFGVGVGQHSQAADRSTADDFEQQVHATFGRLEETLQRVGGTLANIVTMTVFITDVRHGDRFVELRKQYFPNAFPASAMITVAGLGGPEMRVEIQAVAVIGDE